MLRKIFKIIINLVVVALLMIGLLSIVSISKIGDFRLFIVQSGSMEPAIKVGSLIFTKSNSEYEEGDIVTRKIEDEKETITHRIVEKLENGNFITKGDANNTEDKEEVQKEDIVGKTYLIVPYLGYPVAYAQTSQGFIFLIVIPATIFIYEELRKIKKEIAKKFKKKTDNEENENLVEKNKSEQ
jgi:signal peptidase